MIDNKKKKKVYSTALYIRLSKADERKGADRFSESIENQKIVLHEYIDSRINEFNLYKEYIDDGISGTDDLKRPAFMEMINDLKAGRINCIIVKDLSRFARNYIQAGEYMQNTFQLYPTRFIALFDNVDVADGEFDMNAVFKNVLNEDYSRRLSKNLISTFKIRASKGQFIGAFASYGYKRDPENKNHLIIDEAVSGNIKFIFEEFLNGVGKNTIAKKLNDMQIVCPSAYKKQQGLNYQNYKKLESTNSWTYSTVQRILQNRVYCGDLVQHKTNHSKFKPKIMPTQYSPENWVIAEDSHEPIIDKETFNKVQERLKTATRDINFTQNISIFAGHLKCGDCGRAMAKIQNKYKDKVSTRYVCRSYKSNGETTKICSAHSINEDILKEHIITVLNQQIEKYKNLEKTLSDRKDKKVKNKSSEIELRIKELQKALEKINMQIDGYYDLLAEYRINPTQKREYDRMRDRINEKIIERDTLENELKICEEKLSADPRIALNNPIIKDLIQHKRFTELTKEIMDAFISTIWVHEKIETNPETNKEESNLKVEVGFKFEKL